jgi:hypothetical protein
MFFHCPRQLKDSIEVTNFKNPTPNKSQSKFRTIDLNAEYASPILYNQYSMYVIFEEERYLLLKKISIRVFITDRKSTSKPPI